MRWIPTLYFAEGFPNVIVSVIAAIMYKRLAMNGELSGMGNSEIALIVSWLYLPWVIKPFWSPIVDVMKSKRWWILAMQLLLGTAFAGVAFMIPSPSVVQWTLAFFWLAAFASATHDIAADGYYMHQLDTHQQTLYVGIRSTFYRISTMAGQGLLLMLAGNLEAFLRNPVKAWSYTFWFAAALFFLLYLYHRTSLPHPPTDTNKAQLDSRNILRDIAVSIVTFVRKPHFVIAVIFLLLYRFPEALLVRICPLFMLDTPEAGGLALTTSQIGWVQGTIGVVGLTLGGIMGGIAVSRDGFKRWLWPMVFAISVPNAIYIFFAYWQITSISIIATGVFIEQLGYGFGFTAYMLYMLHFSKGEHQTTHYALCTGLMAISLMVPGSFAGWLQLQMGYLNFFILIMLLCPITALVAAKIKIPHDFGKETNK